MAAAWRSLTVRQKKNRPKAVSHGYAMAYCMCWPPLMAMLAPVTKAASSEAR
jgi:hypothetical protein